MNEKIDAHSLTQGQFERAIRNFTHREHLAREAAETEAFLANMRANGFTPKELPAVDPGPKPPGKFDADTEAWLAREFPDMDLAARGIKEETDDVDVD